ncbi:MAG: hypothetical protein H6R18_1278 [Proteobacteria bacterium]|nr:hypothetical protein [Pseudomonadota bacterium]
MNNCCAAFLPTRPAITSSGEIENLSGARLRVKIKHVETILHRPHHSNTLDRQGIKHLREFLAHAGVSVSSLEIN